jgi:hypothetical protein
MGVGNSCSCLPEDDACCYPEVKEPSTILTICVEPLSDEGDIEQVDVVLPHYSVDNAWILREIMRQRREEGRPIMLRHLYDVEGKRVLERDDDAVESFLSAKGIIHAIPAQPTASFSATPPPARHSDFMTPNGGAPQPDLATNSFFTAEDYNKALKNGFMSSPGGLQAASCPPEMVATNNGGMDYANIQHRLKSLEDERLKLEAEIAAAEDEIAELNTPAPGGGAGA